MNIGWVQRSVATQRVQSAGTTTVSLGSVAVSMTVLVASSSSSPTLQGAPIPGGATVNLNAVPGETLAPVVITTATGDDVLLTVII